MRSAVFVDTSAYLAVLKRDDDHHREALAFVESLTRQRAVLFTSNFVIAETHAMVLRYLGHEAARSFLQEVDDSRATVVVRTEATDEVAARSIIYRYADKDFSLTDAISFAIMARLGLSQAFTFDNHFEQYGWRVLHA